MLSTSAFDAIADDYDASFTQSAVGRALRELVWTRLVDVFRPGQCILELGCGTGEDARWLAERGIDVLATDASSRMIERAKAKMSNSTAAARVTLRCLPMEELSSLPATGRFDGVLSNFGALNCVADLAALGRVLVPLLRPGAHLVWIVMGRHVPWEWLWYMAHGQPRKAVRRFRTEATPWRGIAIRYPTPSEVARALGPYFEVTRHSPLGWALPPSYAARWLERAPRALASLTRLESLAQGNRMLASLADHFILEARLRPAD
jgi:SAM-dependent methyltransferase